MRERLTAASDHVAARLRADAAPADIIAELVRDHGATYKTLAWTNTLRVAGVMASCTSSRDTLLLEHWRRGASLRLMEPEGGYGHE